MCSMQCFISFVRLCDMAGEPQQRSLKNRHPALAPPGAVTGEPLASWARGEACHHEPTGKVLQSIFGPQGTATWEIWDAQWDAEEEHWGFYKIYHEMFSRGTKAGEREGSRWFRGEQEWENRGIRR